MNVGTVTGWTDERVALLKKLNADGLSCSLIAAELGGGVTRNGVIGKLHRLGLSKTRPLFQRPRREPRLPRERIPCRPRRLPRAVSFVSLPPEPLPEEPPFDMPAAQRCGLLELDTEKCHWPVGDPAQADFFFCGGRANAGSPYCGFHGRVAYTPPPARRRREHQANPLNRSAWS